MPYALPSHERREPCSTAVTPDITRPTCRPTPLGRLLLLVVPHMFLVCRAAATPVEGVKGSASLLRRVESNTGSVASAQIWAPIAAVVLFIALATVGLCYKRAIVDWIGRRRNPNVNSAGTGTGNAQGTRELTAEQLAGTNNGTAPATTASRTARRTRRPRRTPSQISTTSLPAYAKEPGEQELVIFRGPEDMEDAGILTTVMMPPLSEDGESLSMHSRDNSQGSRYSPVPASPNDMPLLQQDEPADHSTQIPAQNERNIPRQSIETLNSSEEASSLMRVTSNAPDPRGAAPAYFEAVDRIPEDTNGSLQTSTLPSSLESAGSPAQAPRRRSGFRTLLNALPNRLSMSSHPQTHNRGNSAFSMVSSDQSHGQETSQSHASHRPTHSGSGSLLSLSPFRTISHQRSQNNLNSPSLISVNSISAPLTHTLTRSEFTYPKAGPTPEQLKLISSRESFARFGMPYGPDAIAYAASTSRHDLDVPPPDFDLQPPLADTHGLPGSAGPSGLRATRNAADFEREADAEAEDASSSAANARSVTPDVSVDAAATSQGLVNDQEANPTLTSDTSPVSGLPSSKDKGKTKEVSSPHRFIDDTYSSSTHVPSGARVAEGSSSHPSTDEPVASTAAASDSSGPAPHTSTSTSTPSAEPSGALLNPMKSTTSPTIASPSLTQATPSLGVPPSSFRVPSTFSGRSESRASSIQSFATAAESMVPSSSDDDDDSDYVDEPTTPTLGGRHVLEPTDATIRATPTQQN